MSCCLYLMKLQKIISFFKRHLPATVLSLVIVVYAMVLLGVCLYGMNKSAKFNSQISSIEKLKDSDNEKALFVLNQLDTTQLGNRSKGKLLLLKYEILCNKTNGAIDAEKIGILDEAINTLVHEYDEPADNSNDSVFAKALIEKAGIEIRNNNFPEAARLLFEASACNRDHAPSISYRIKIMQNQISREIPTLQYAEIGNGVYNARVDRLTEKSNLMSFTAVMAIISIIAMLAITVYVINANNRKLHHTQLQLAGFIDTKSESLSKNKQLSSTPQYRCNDFKKEPERRSYSGLSVMFEKDYSSLLNETHQFFNTEDDNPMKEKLGKIVTSHLKDLNRRYSYGKLEKAVDDQENDVLSRMSKQIPKLNHKEIHFIALILSGCPAILVSLIMDESPNYCRTLKSRILKKIKESESEDKEYFISILARTVTTIQPDRE